jgi:hypothetical protein
MPTELYIIDHYLRRNPAIINPFWTYMSYFYDLDCWHGAIALWCQLL